MANHIEHLHTYLSALDRAAEALDLARRIKPDPGLDHALLRLGSLLQDGSRELQTRTDVGCGCACRDSG